MDSGPVVGLGTALMRAQLAYVLAVLMVLAALVYGITH